MIIKSYKDSNGTYSYIIEQENKKMIITFGGNLDLYWSFTDLEAIDDLIYGNLIIKKDDKILYNLFNNLFNSIKSANPFENYDKTVFDYSSYDMYKELFDGEKITWISDDRDLENDSLLKISKIDEIFQLEFAKRKKEYNYYYFHDYSNKKITIRFRNSGSHYAPFNCVFMKMYRDLAGYSTELGQMPSRDLNEIPGQISIEEYIGSLKNNTNLQKNIDFRTHI